MDSRSDGLPMAKNWNQFWTWMKQTIKYQRQVIRIDVLPDDVLLRIFDFYVDVYPVYGITRAVIEIWRTLVHVCRRWRKLVFQSPRRLNLQLFCSPKTRAKDKLDVWPALPLIVRGNVTSSSGTGNAIAALERSNRVWDVLLLNTVGGQFEQVLAAMQVPFPELIQIQIQLMSRDETPAAIPDSFLGGSAPPSLQYFSLSGFPFPGLPKLLLSADRLVDLRLSNIPHSGYISPEAIVTLLSTLSTLVTLNLEFRSPQSRPDRQSRSLSPPNRSTLPLRRLHFKGVTEYLEDLVIHIDAPQLDEMHITFFNQIDFYCPRLAQFISCTPTLRAFDKARVRFDERTASVQLRHQASTQSGLDGLEIGISCREPDWQLSSVEQICNSSLLPISTVEDLDIVHALWEREAWRNSGIENALWLQVLLPFTALKNLYLDGIFAPGIAAALQELVGSRITEVLPSLGNIFVEGKKPSEPFQEIIGQFVSARQLSDHPITISNWDTD